MKRIYGTPKFNPIRSKINPINKWGAIILCSILAYYTKMAKKMLNFSSDNCAQY